MKKVLKWLLGIIGVIYGIIVIFLSICLIGYNDYKITELGNYSLIIVNDKSLEPEFKKGSLVVASKEDTNLVKTGEEIFFYNTYDNQVSVSVGKVIDKQIITKDETTFVIEGGYSLSSEYFIGRVDTVSVYEKLGSVLAVLESRIGFLLFIVLPVLVGFIYAIYAIVKEIKEPSED